MPGTDSRESHLMRRGTRVVLLVGDVPSDDPFMPSKSKPLCSGFLPRRAKYARRPISERTPAGYSSRFWVPQVLLEMYRVVPAPQGSPDGSHTRRHVSCTIDLKRKRSEILSSFEPKYAS
jgi:hypothetical protein